MAAIVGVITGVGALVFRVMISVIHNLFFLKTFSLNYDSSLFTPGSPWGAAVIFVPVVGGIIVTFIVSNFAPEAKGHGVPEVMDAIYYKGGVIRPVVAAVKSSRQRSPLVPARRLAAKDRSSRLAPRWAPRSVKFSN